MNWKRSLALGSVLLLLPAIGVAAEPVASSLVVVDPPGDAGGTACLEFGDGFECFSNGDNQPKVDILQVTADVDGDARVVDLDLAEYPAFTGEYDYFGHAVVLTSDPAPATGGTISLDRFQTDRGVEVSTTVRVGSQEGDKNPSACAENTVVRDDADTAADIRFRIVPACLALIGSPPALWVQSYTDASFGGDTIYGDLLDAKDADGRPLPEGPVFTAEAATRISRIAGSSRYDTAVQVSERQFPDGADTVYLARGIDPLVDALAGGMVTDGPVLLVPPTGDIPAVVAAEITRVDPDEVIALGGPAAVSDQVLRDAADGRDRSRLAGDTRYDTAIAVAARQFPDGADTVYLARGIGNLVDAIAGGTIPDGPVLLVPPSGAVPDEVLDAVDTLDPDGVVALGGPLAIEDDVVAQVARGRATSRLAGESRYDTTIAVAERFFPAPTRIHLARAVDPLVDALAGGMVTQGPIVLVPSDGTLPASVATYLDGLAEDVEIVVLGGTAAVSDDVLGRAANAVAGVR